MKLFLVILDYIVGLYKQVGTCEKGNLLLLHDGATPDSRFSDTELAAYSALQMAIKDIPKDVLYKTINIPR